jgi:hypothetical protein
MSLLNKFVLELDLSGETCISNERLLKYVSLNCIISPSGEIGIFSEIL